MIILTAGTDTPHTRAAQHKVTANAPVLAVFCPIAYPATHGGALV
ncbi:hypothetical protein [Pseudorhodobacter ferrugineus]|nr:hypothetical protein [Pseudorhodobacter ferrugineus]